MVKEPNKSLSEVHSSINIPTDGRKWKRLLAFFGPAYLVSVGYMDPGNWATDLEGGSRFGYQLIWILLLSNLVALLLQSISARLGIVSGYDLAQASRAMYPKAANIGLYILAEISIAACDLAEVIGMAIGLNLLFGIPLLVGVSISVLDTFLLLFLLNKGMRKMEAFIIVLVCIIGVSFIIEMFIVKPEPLEILKGLVPTRLNSEALYIAIGIIGATVMPHNLYLHSALVQTRRYERNDKGIRQAIKYNVLDSAIALNLALFVNAAILVLAAGSFYGKYEVAQIQDAYKLLEGLFGNLAPILFAIALIAAGQSSTITGTLAGQIIMEGHVNLRLRPWLRRLVTRMLAIIPAVGTIVISGPNALGSLIILSQVILSLQLGFAMVPLIHFVSSKKRMGKYAIAPWLKFLAWLSTIVIVGLNANLVYQKLSDYIPLAPTWQQLLILTIVFAAIILFIYILIAPWLSILRKRTNKLPHGLARELGHLNLPRHHRICIAIDFSDMDKRAIEHALAHGGDKAEYILVHAVESAGARLIGEDILDFETQSDTENITLYTGELIKRGYRAACYVGYGSPVKVIPQMVIEHNADMVVMGAHGHKGFKDLLFGETADAVRHRVSVPVFIVKG